MLAGQTILIVDDDPTQLLILEGYFRSLRAATVLEANSATDALTVLKQQENSVDLIVSDLMMPDLDGIEFLRELKVAKYGGKLALISSLDQVMINSARKLGEMHGLNIIGTCRKPLRKASLDSVFLIPESPRGKFETVRDLDVTAERIMTGLNNGEFHAFYQPKVDVRQKRVVGAEALARWCDPEKGLLAPADFLPVIVKENLTNELSFKLMKTIFQDIAAWKRQGLNIKTSINVTAREIDILEFPDIVARLLRESDVLPSDIVIEITENAVVEFNANSLEVLSRLRLMGTEIAIDDFGTGFANITALKEFPYTELKIDQSFIRGKTNDPFCQETVRAAVTLGRQMNMRLLAEGIETPEEWEFVKQRGVDEVQGYLVAKPMPVDEFVLFCLKNDGAVALPAVRETHQRALQY